jgi:hypothetical protein
MFFLAPPKQYLEEWEREVRIGLTIKSGSTPRPNKGMDSPQRVVRPATKFQHHFPPTGTCAADEI